MHVDRVYRHIYYRIGNIVDTEDLTQQVFLKAWQAIGRYKKTSSPFLAWLIRISHNLVVDFYRSKKYHVNLNHDLRDEDQESNPEQFTEARFGQSRMRAAIMQLPGEQQQVILMRFIEDFPFADIAAALGKSEGAIRVILHRALKKLRGILGNVEGER
jgi:RNA polymerase sigma-70 factor (ECF subfamily)